MNLLISVLYFHCAIFPRRRASLVKLSYACISCGISRQHPKCDRIFSPGKAAFLLNDVTADPMNNRRAKRLIKDAPVHTIIGGKKKTKKFKQRPTSQFPSSGHRDCILLYFFSVVHRTISNESKYTSIRIL